MEESKRDYIINLLAKKVGRDPSSITDNVRLLHDLGLDGDDAMELIAEISNALKIDNSVFDLSKYFRSEPSLWSLLWFLPSQKRDRIASKHPLTVAELISAAERGNLT